MKISFFSRTFVLFGRAPLFYHRYNNISIPFLQIGYILLFVRLRLEYAPPYSTQSSYICVHLSYALKVFLRSASFSRGNVLSLRVPGCVFDWNTSMLSYNFPRMGMHFPVIHEALAPAILPAQSRRACRPQDAGSKPFCCWYGSFRTVLARMPVRRLYSIGGVHSPPEPLPELPPEPPLPLEPPESPPLGAATIGVVRTVSAVT